MSIEHEHDSPESDTLAELGRMVQAQAHEEVLPPLEARPLPNFLQFFPPLIHTFWKEKVYVEMDKDGFLKIDGFYKNGPMRLGIENVNGEFQIHAIDKREKKTLLKDFQDLVTLNYQWWIASSTKDSFAMPQRPFLDHFVERKMVQRKVIYVPNETTDLE